MLVTKRCMITGVYNTLDLPITEDQYLRFDRRHISGEYIQDILPNLSASQREFLLTGILEETWNEHMTEKSFCED